MTSSIRYLDVETTGLEPDSEIVELAIVDERGDALLDTLVRPTRATAWEEAQGIHGIGPADIVTAPTIEELTERIGQALVGSEVVAYNASFDLYFIPAAARTWSQAHCAMLAFTDLHGEWDDYYGNRRFVSLDAATSHVFCSIRHRHRALYDALRCRAVWHYLTDPDERARVDNIHHQRAVAEEAEHELRYETHMDKVHAEDKRRLQERALMSWLRFPLWLPPAADGRSAVERSGYDVYHEHVVTLFTGYSRKVHELRRKYAHLPEYRSIRDIPSRLVPMSRLQAPPWARRYLKPRARYVSRSGTTFRLLYRADALKEAYAKHPLRRPFAVPRGHALFTRTQLRAAGYTRAELESLTAVREEQNCIDHSWYPLFCMREVAVARRRQMRRGSSAARPGEAKTTQQAWCAAMNERIEPGGDGECRP